MILETLLGMVELSCVRVLWLVPCTCHSTMMLVYWVLAAVILTCFCNDDAMPMCGRLAHNIDQSSFALVS